MKPFFIVIFLFFNQLAFAQNEADKTVTLTVTGEGKTKQEARTNALRSAIEQAYGTFISSNTKVVNDSLIKDEIVSITNGNIQKFEVVSEMQLPNGNFANITKATVSVSKLTTFCESKGLKVEFKGGLFAENIRVQELNEKNEEKAINNLVTILAEIQKKCFDYKINVKDPVQNGSLWKVNIEVKVTPNDNLKIYQSTLIEGLNAIAMTRNEVSNYEKIKKEVYLISIPPVNFNLSFRNKNTIDSILLNVLGFVPPILSFEISNGIKNKGALVNEEDNFIYSSQRRDADNFTIDGTFNPIVERAKSYNYGEMVSHSAFSLIKDYFSFKKHKYYSSINLKEVIIDFKNAFGKEIIFNYEDNLTLDEIKKITEYKIIPNK